MALLYFCRIILLTVGFNVSKTSCISLLGSSHSKICHQFTSLPGRITIRGYRIFFLPGQLLISEKILGEYQHDVFLSLRSKFKTSGLIYAVLFSHLPEAVLYIPTKQVVGVFQSYFRKSGMSLYRLVPSTQAIGLKVGELTVSFYITLNTKEFIGLTIQEIHARTTNASCLLKLSVLVFFKQDKT